MGVAHLVAAQPPEPHLIDQHPSRQPVIDDATAAPAVAGPPRRAPAVNPIPPGYSCATLVGVTTPAIRFGRDIPDDRELRLCGDISDGKRAIELGVSRQQNAIAFALAGAKAIAVDPSAEAIADLRAAAAKAEVTVECHHGDLADLGFATSGSAALVVANHTLTDVDDLGRLLRQVHRVLRASHPFVISVPHPFAGVHSSDQYGSKVHAVRHGRAHDRRLVHPPQPRQLPRRPDPRARSHRDQPRPDHARHPRPQRRRLSSSSGYLGPPPTEP